MRTESDFEPLNVVAVSRQLGSSFAGRRARQPGGDADQADAQHPVPRIGVPVAV